jgi:hypothetical protein
VVCPPDGPVTQRSQPCLGGWSRLGICHDGSTPVQSASAGARNLSRCSLRVLFQTWKGCRQGCSTTRFSLQREVPISQSLLLYAIHHGSSSNRPCCQSSYWGVVSRWSLVSRVRSRSLSFLTLSRSMPRRSVTPLCTTAASVAQWLEWRVRGPRPAESNRQCR